MPNTEPVIGSESLLEISSDSCINRTKLTPTANPNKKAYPILSCQISKTTKETFAPVSEAWCLLFHGFFLSYLSASN